MFENRPLETVGAVVAAMIVGAAMLLAVQKYAAAQVRNAIERHRGTTDASV